MASNPVLEAFGNASTCRNPNSSRFGKWLRVRLRRSGVVRSAELSSLTLALALTRTRTPNPNLNQVRSAELSTFLLEKARVTAQLPGERNFHILHQVP